MFETLSLKRFKERVFSKRYLILASAGCIPAATFSQILLGSYPSKMPAWVFGLVLWIVGFVLVPLLFLPVAIINEKIFPEPDIKDELYRQIDSATDTYIKNGLYMGIALLWCYLSFTESSIQINAGSNFFLAYAFLGLVGEVIVKRLIIRKILK